MPTKTITLIFAIGRFPPLKTVMSSHKWVFHSFLENTVFFLPYYVVEEW